MAISAELTAGLTEIFRSAPSDAEAAAFQAICDAAGIDAAYRAAVDADGADAARTVISFYQVFYGREPDAAGLDFWTQQVESGNVSLNQLADAFAQASEFNDRYGDRTPTEIVFAQYRNVLGREPDFAGLEFWTNQVSSGNLSLADLGRFFATSDEFEDRADPFIDAFLINAANGDQDYDTSSSLFDETFNGVPVGGPGGGLTSEPIRLAGAGNDVNGGSAADVFAAEDGDLTSAMRINGGGDRDTLTVFSEDSDFGRSAVSPTMRSVETVVWTEQTNDRQSDADNNVGGYTNGNSVMVDVELDAGRIRDVQRWEDYDSRADLVIEDARDSDDTDGTFTGDLEVAMVSTDPGNVDYAIYFDNPVNTSTSNDSIFIEVIDQNNSNTFSAAAVNNTTPGSLEDAQLDFFRFMLNGETVTVTLDPTDTAFFGPNATYTDLLNAINDAIDNTTLADGTPLNTLVEAGFGGTFFENIGNDNGGAGTNAQVFGRQIVIDGNAGVNLEDAGPGDFRVIQLGEPADIAASVRAQNIVNEELIRINVDLDDVGKGSMGGDLMIGAMSVGRQGGDDRTSDSVGIQQFDIEVDRSSQLQTINSTNNSLEVVNIVNGENNGPNNTTTAADELIGDLVVRGRANPQGNIATDNPMPGAVPQHNDWGFSDVRVINAAAMVGSVDLTAELTDEVLEKYLTLDDTDPTGNSDDIFFDYDLGTNDDEFLLNVSDSALIDAGVGSREDVDITVDGNAGDDTIVTNVGGANKVIDGQGQDYYLLFQDPFFGQQWYANQANNNAATIRVNGGAGDDSIYTHGWGDAAINAGSGEDVVYTDNAGAVNLPFNLMNNISRNIDEHEQIDYEVGAAWTFNDDNGGDDDATGFGFVGDISGSTNDLNAVALPDANRNAGTAYETQLTVSFFGANGANDTEYSSTVTIPDAVINANGQVTDQVINQAIKDAINDDPVLSKVLEAVDGPGQSLAVYSKIDGDFVRDDLVISIFEDQTTGGNTVRVPFAIANTGYDTAGVDPNVDFQNFGGASAAESDNGIVVSADGAADVTVLSTNDGFGATTPGPHINGASNETMTFVEGFFGVETVFNFDAGDAAATSTGGEDRFDFREIDFATVMADFSNGAINVADDSISIVAETAANDTLGEVEDFFDGAAAGAAPTEHIVIVYDENDDNGGMVYYVSDTTGGAATGRLLGEIELIGTDWSTLTFDNFL